MITAITLKNFKCFKNEYIEISPLTVLAGLNGSGKSTVIQSLLLLRQSNNENLLEKGLTLNGEYINVGTGKDLLYEQAEGPEEILISLESNKAKMEWTFDYNSKSNFLALKHYNGIHSLDSVSLFTDQFEYLSAERSGPRSVSPKSNYIVAEHRHIGVNGEFTQHYLHNFETDVISNLKATNPKTQELNLINQVQSWLDVISPGVRIVTSEYSQADLVGLQFKFINTEVSNTYRPTNVGFGITYGLPVIVALLKAKADDLVIIENPEAHIHPYGQRKIGELISRVVSGGVQVIVETHSDHILNGIRLSVKRNLISKDEVRLNFLQKVVRGNQIIHEVLSPQIKEDGRLDNWPDGFFDEWDRVLDELF